MKTITVILGVLAALYVLLCIIVYFKQESLLFFPTKLPADYRFRFPGQFEEQWTTASDGTKLHGLLFKAPASKGLVFYLHGNGGALNSWGESAAVYTALHYDVFLLDYRGYGKSEGHITSQKQLFGDVQAAYQQLLPVYPESRTVILGYSLGTGLAAWLAAHQHPKQLILQAPYFSMRDLSGHLYPFLPRFLLRYPLLTNEFVQQVSAPIALFHGDQDEVIYYGSSLKLKALLKPADKLILLPGGHHNDITDNTQYQRELANILQK
jgi:alpha-beta hydrolase superfamily lysophospholipase